MSWKEWCITLSDNGIFRAKIAVPGTDEATIILPETMTATRRPYKYAIDGMQLSAGDDVYVIPMSGTYVLLGGAVAGGGGDDCLPLAGGTMQGAINMDGNRVTNLPTPTETGDAAPKNYVDALHSADIADIAELASELGIVVNGNTCQLGAAAGQYIILRDSTITGKPDGLYKASKAIPPAPQTIDGTYLSAIIPHGAANELDAAKSTRVKTGWEKSMTLTGVSQLILQINISLFAVSITVPVDTPVVNMARMGDYTTAQYAQTVEFPYRGNAAAADDTVKVTATSADSLYIETVNYPSFKMAIY